MLLKYCGCLVALTYLKFIVCVCSWYTVLLHMGITWLVRCSHSPVKVAGTPAGRADFFVAAQTEQALTHTD